MRRKRTGFPPLAGVTVRLTGEKPSVVSASAVNLPYIVSPSIGEVSATSATSVMVSPPLRSSV